MKILIIGTVGTGKTTLAKKLSKEMNIKYYEIDSIVHDDSKNGEKRSLDEQDKIVKEINQSESWIIEGVLRKNLYYLLDFADKIIYLDVDRRVRNRRIFLRFIKQLLGIEEANYKPDLKMLKNMYNWSNSFEIERNDFEKLLKEYESKVEKIR